MIQEGGADVNALALSPGGWYNFFSEKRRRQEDEPRIRFSQGCGHVLSGHRRGRSAPGAALRLYFQTGKIKDVSRQIHANPKIEICAFKDGAWLRVAASACADDRIEAQEHMLESYPMLKGMYKAGDGNTEVFYLKDATATFSSFGGAPETVKF